MSIAGGVKHSFLIGAFSGRVERIDEHVTWVWLHCGNRWCWVPKFIASDLQVGDELMFSCYQTDEGICGRPLQTTSRARMRTAA